MSYEITLLEGSKLLLLLMFLTCHVIYLPLKKIHTGNSPLPGKTNFPIRFVEFPTRSKVLPIEMEILIGFKQDFLKILKSGGKPKFHIGKQPA